MIRYSFNTTKSDVTPWHQCLTESETEGTNIAPLNLHCSQLRSVQCETGRKCLVIRDQSFTSASSLVTNEPY
ncbi:hypothetical protein E2C01_016135 [Portunus trituberculatus]|uniref:Uncharacterized protein n=1 Tax=Portunus trituberculatus TaxID=210409 RepID=A0A5B7DPR0_PORTR|nr:hypothetical protein [Portunus trituberculatus]